MSHPSSCVSFVVDPNTYRIVSACGLDTSDQLELWRQACPNINCPDDGTDCWIPYRPAGELVTLTEARNPLIVETPGSYRMMFTGPTNSDVSVCVSDAYHVTVMSRTAGV